MKIAVRMGHQSTGSDLAAPGEFDVIRKYAPYVINGLQREGHEVLDVTPPEANRSLSDSLYYGINKANEWGADLFVSCHGNAGGGHGCEVLYLNGSTGGQSFANNIVNEIANLGYTNRGAKIDVRGLAELRATNMPAVIIEPLFVDSDSDISMFNPEKLGYAIVKGITGQSVISTPKSTQSYDFSTLQGYIGAVQDNIPGNETLSKCPLLQFGSSGNVVKWLQNRLNYLGYGCGTADGAFGNNTLKAIKKVQLQYGISADGIVGPCTWKIFLGL